MTAQERIMMMTEDDLDTMVATAEAIEKGKACSCCGHSFTPIDDKDKFCKKCLRNLYFELIRDAEKMFDSLEDKWRLEEGKNVVDRHKQISGVP